MLIFVQNQSTTITIGPVITSAGIISSGMTTAASIVYQNGGNATTLSLTSVAYKTGGLYQIDLSSNAVANVGRVFINVVCTAGYNGGGPVYGGVMPTTNQAFFYNATYIPAILSSYSWNTETSRLLSSAAAAATAVWAAASRTLTSWGGISTAAPSTLSAAEVWTYSTRTLTSGAIIGDDVWAETTRTLTSWGGQSTFTAADVWSVAARTLTSTPPSTWGPTDVWNFTTRLLTSGAAIAPDVWLNSTRTLTSGSAVAPDVWNNSTRSLTSAAVVWSESSRTLTSWGGIPTASTWGASDVWGYATRTLTSAASVWDQLLETTLSYKNAMEGLTAAVLGESTGGGTTSVKFRNFGSTVDRLTYDVSTVGNRKVTAYSW